jgi:hypothetical protein
MKKLGIAFIMALLALAFVAVPAFAWNQYVDADIECGEMGSSNDSPQVGDTIYFYGSAIVNATAKNDRPYYCNGGWGTYAKINAYVHYVVYAPDGVTVVAEDTVHMPTEKDVRWFYTLSSVELEDLPIEWNSGDFDVLSAGEYIAYQDGYVKAEYGYWLFECGESEPVWVPVDYDEAYCGIDPPCSYKVIALSNAPLATGRTRPILTILTSQDKDVYFPSEGWGDPTTDDIVYNDGTWQVEIADGTKILLDGVWHRKTWIEVDDQGNVIGRYGSGGHIVAEEIALSSPITITKVG